MLPISRVFASIRRLYAQFGRVEPNISLSWTSLIASDKNQHALTPASISSSVSKVEATDVGRVPSTSLSLTGQKVSISGTDSQVSVASLDPALSKDALTDLKQNFKTWRRISYDGRHFYNAHLYELWMERVEPGEHATNTQRLLRALEGKIDMHRSTPAPIRDRQILHGRSRCVLVFGVLLEQDRGELIDIFMRAGISDQNLAISESCYAELQEELSRKRVADSDRIIQSFEDAKWAFCPAEVNLNMEARFKPQEILPFCRREIVNSKGGTAEVFQAAIQKEFVHEDLQKVLKPWEYADVEFGPVSSIFWPELYFCAKLISLKCYQIAIKTFSHEMCHIALAEQEALLSLSAGDYPRSLKTFENKPLVRWLGFFLHDDITTRRKTYNLLLEYGDFDLEEFFRQSIPLATSEEIISFWKSLFKIADALQLIHQLSYNEHRHYLG